MNPVSLPVVELSKFGWFRSFARSDSAAWIRDGIPGVRLFEMVVQEERRFVGLLRLIRAEDTAYWDSCRELLSFAVQSAQPSVEGSFELKILALDLAQRWQYFNPANLASLIVNHCRKLTPGGHAVFPYASVLGLLRKLAGAHFGKITLDHGVLVYNKTPGFLETRIKTVVEAHKTLSAPGPLVFRIDGLGRTSWFSSGGDEEAEMLASLRRAALAARGMGVREFYFSAPGCEIDLMDEKPGGADCES